MLIDSGYKRIEEIRKGDNVWAYNDTTQEYARKRVVDVFEYVRDTIYTIQIGNERINATSDHPFFIGGRWLNVSELQVGDSVVTYEGKKLVISAIEKTASQTKVYNFEVEDYHNYYVTGLNILVHNSIGPCDNAQKTGATSLRKVGTVLESVDDVFANPNLLKGKSPLQVEGILGKTPGWKVESLGKGAHKGQGMILREYGPKGSTGRMIQWHPGGGHHGAGSYWKVSSGAGTVRVF